MKKLKLTGNNRYTRNKMCINPGGGWVMELSIDADQVLASESAHGKVEE